MERRNFIRSGLLSTAAFGIGLPGLKGSIGYRKREVSKLKIKKIRYYSAPGYNKPLFNQARGIVEIETDGGITGIGEGGFKDTIDQCAQMIIGQDPFRIEHIWQLLYRGMFYPPGREKPLLIWSIELSSKLIYLFEVRDARTAL